MKAVALVLGTLLVLALAGPLVVESATQSPAPSSAPSSTPGSGDSSGTSGSPGASSSGSPAASSSVDMKSGDRPASGTEKRTNVDVNINKDDRSAGAGRSDDGAALPRGAADDRTTIFGLSPTAAVIIAAALLVVVILAIVAMTRSGETTYVDRERRM